MYKIQGIFRTHESSLGLGATALLWGLTFPLIRTAMSDVSPQHFVAFRFLIAVLALSPALFLSVKVRRETWRALPYGVILAVLLYLSFLLQTKGLQTVSASRGAFLTAISVLMVPILGPFFGRPFPSKQDWLGASAALAGIFILLAPAGGTSVDIGDAWVLAAALCMTLYMHCLQRVYARGFGDLSLSILQIGGTAVIAWLALPFFPERLSLSAWTPSSITSMLLCALLVTVGSFFLHTRYQKRTSPEHAALIFCLEPVFATLFGFVLLGEGLKFHELAGSLLILGAIVGTELIKHRSISRLTPPAVSEEKRLRPA